MCSDARETCWRCDGEGGWFIRLHQGSAPPKWLDCEKCDGTGFGVSPNDRWTTALGVPAGTEPEDAVRMVQRRAFRWLLESDVAADIALDARDAEIQRGKHVRDQTTHPDPSSAVSE